MLGSMDCLRRIDSFRLHKLKECVWHIDPKAGGILFQRKSFKIYGVQDNPMPVEINNLHIVGNDVHT